MTDIIQFVPEHFKTAEGTFLAAFLKAVNEQASITDQMIEAGVQQQFLSTATGRYLLLLGEQSGFALPANSGLDITAIKAIVPAMVSAPKQVSISVDQLVEIFYGANNVSPNTTCLTFGPYSLLNGDNLIVETDQGTVNIPILANQVSDITNVSAQEIVGIINLAQSIFYANVFTNTQTGQEFVQLNSRGFGVRPFIRIAGGTLQNVLQFPKIDPTALLAGMVWNISKPATYDDFTKFTWNGSGSNPQVYNVNIGDTVTIRGLVDGVTPNSQLNGSYVVTDCGYDYFTVQNQNFGYTSATFTQPLNNTILFTSQDPIKLYDHGEYAVLSETFNNTTSIVVPAVPTLTKRFLEGSAHLHGYEYPVTTFTRTTLTIDDSLSEIPPVDDNAFVLSNNRMVYDYSPNMQVKTVSSNTLVPKTMNIDQTDEIRGVLPYTVVTLVGTDVLHGEVGEEDILLTFPYKHGLRNYWGFTLNTTSQAGNLNSGLLNKEQRVSRVVDDFTVAFKALGPDGAPIKFSGTAFNTFSVYQYTAIQPDASDFYLQFPSSAAVTAAGIKVGMKIDLVGGTVVNPYIANQLLNGYLQVESIVANIVNVRSGLGVGAGGLIITNPTGYIPASFGGTVTYFLDQTTVHNQDYVMTNLKASFLSNSGSVNPNYVGSFLYDPLGTSPYSKATLTSVSAVLDQPLLEGDNEIVIFVNTVEGFPTSGHIVMDYGTDSFEGPIFYSSIIQNSLGDSQIVIDPSYRFKHTHLAGASINVVSQTVPYKPTLTGSDFPVYITSPAQARNTLQQLIKLLLAAGIFLDFDVLFPSLRYQDPAISPYA